MAVITQRTIKKTDDGSFTLYSKEYDEPYHSVNGAIQEAFFKFSIPCKIDILSKSGAVAILDIGFGLGYNVLSAIHTARKDNPGCIVDIVSFENDPIDADTLCTLAIPVELKESYEKIREAAFKLNYDKDGIKITILAGDARGSIQNIGKKFDAVFLDPFSVQKNVELWTVDFFSELYKRMTDSAILATYSASTPVRTGLMEAGFKIGPGPGDGMKKGGTLASKSADIAGFSEKETKKFKTSPERKPFYDPGLNLTRDEIFMLRGKI